VHGSDGRALTDAQASRGATSLGRTTRLLATCSAVTTDVPAMRA